MYFVKHGGVPQPKNQQPAGDPFAFDVVCEQPSPRSDAPEKSEVEVGGWLDGTMS
jgi:hypothetical protein